MNKEKLKKQTWVFLALFAAVMLPNKLWFDNKYLEDRMGNAMPVHYG